MYSLQLHSRVIPADTHCWQRFFPCHLSVKRLSLRHSACGRAACFCCPLFSDCHTQMRLPWPHNCVRYSHNARACFSAWAHALLHCTSLRRALTSHAAAATSFSRRAPSPAPLARHAGEGARDERILSRAMACGIRKPVLASLRTRFVVFPLLLAMSGANAMPPNIFHVPSVAQVQSICVLWSVSYKY